MWVFSFYLFGVRSCVCVFLCVCSLLENLINLFILFIYTFSYAKFGLEERNNSKSNKTTASWTQENIK